MTVNRGMVDSGGRGRETGRAVDWEEWNCKLATIPQKA